MLRALTGGTAGDLRWSLGGRPFGSPIGLRMLVPGLLQHRWGQRQRGWVVLRIVRVGPDGRISGPGERPRAGAFSRSRL